ncbi:hypothetical protein SAMN05444354_10294 [Stigmatella aurantiaca]|uniref:Uncharacterized protein n=1 Tax=Stigmatella aurantiaca TaxID=41 RepID=A0A1H7J7B2_STIAU|nr:hypothetical protein [Stigmatella aurantiaca]SEK69035.1 hypothetical protein SAMN05444354_10294 [Stigmatella aurantiaca]
MFKRIFGSAPQTPPSYPSSKPTYKDLKASIGQDDFYKKMAEADPANAGKWKEMVEVQKQFKDAEPSYRHPEARTYSESNRETLHRAATKLLKEQGADHVYDDFIRMHPAVFKENGACSLPVMAQVSILGNTKSTMVNGENAKHLLTGLKNDSQYLDLVQAAAQKTREARQKEGKPVTLSGYTIRKQD